MRSDVFQQRHWIIAACLHRDFGMRRERTGRVHACDDRASLVGLFSLLGLGNHTAELCIGGRNVINGLRRQDRAM